MHRPILRPKASSLSGGSLDADPEDLLLVGWREAVALPELGLDVLYAKLDSGASLSTLHAEELEIFQKRKEKWVRFLAYCDADDTVTPYRCEARWMEERAIRSSNGQIELRPVIETSLYLGGFQWTIELTLTDRSSLEHKILLGRSALASRCAIDCSRSYLLSRRMPA